MIKSLFSNSKEKDFKQLKKIVFIKRMVEK